MLTNSTYRPIDRLNEFGLLVESDDNATDLDRWVLSNRVALERALMDYGVILLRGFRCETAADFGNAVDAISPIRVDYSGGNAPRSEVAPGIYTSSELPPPPVVLAQHYEMVPFATSWPMKLVFYCAKPATAGGETPVTSSRVLTQQIDPRIIDQFERHAGVMYVRNFRRDIPFKTLADTYGTTDRAKIEATCRDGATEFEWRGADWLCTRQRRPVFRTHPRTGETFFVATPHLWHRSSWIESIGVFGKEYSKDALLAQNPADLWMHAFYGDGQDIEESIIQELSALHERTKVVVPWQLHDVMIVENLLAAHGRNAYSGDRLILAALREPFHADRGYLYPSSTQSHTN